MKKFLNAFRFMTIIPIPGSSHADLNDAGKSAVFFPLVGLVIGALISTTAFLLSSLWPPIVVAVITTALWVILTAGLHIDGLADLADGIGGGWDPESRLRIMKDSAIGTYGALAIVLLLMLKAVFILQAIDSGLFSVLLLIPVAGRCSQVLSIRLFRPARKEGFGAVFKAAVNNSSAIIAVLITLVLLTAVWGWIGSAVTLAGLLFMLAAGAWVASRLGGLTGDSYGAICELTEVFLLIGLSLLKPEFTGWLRFLIQWPG